MTTQTYCVGLLEAVQQAGRDPELAYLARTRLRRALVALERGRVDEPRRMLDGAPADVRALACNLAERVVWLCQPSEALDVRWKRDWTSVLDDVAYLSRWIAATA